MANPVERATITPLYINHPAEGKKWGKVKVVNEPWTIANGYFIMPHVLPHMQPGQAYAVEYEIRDFQGASMKVITKATPSTQPQVAGNGAAAATNVAQNTRWQPQQKPIQEQCAIYVCGIINNAMSAGILVLDTTSLVEATNAAVDAFYNSKLSKPYQGQEVKTTTATAPKKPTAAEEMDDSIPF